MVLQAIQRRLVRVAAMLAATFALTPVVGAQGIASLDEAITSLSNPMRVLVIAAHPDDEDT